MGAPATAPAFPWQRSVVRAGISSGRLRGPGYGRTPRRSTQIGLLVFVAILVLVWVDRVIWDVRF
jgi:hypothetical protein